MGRPPVDGAPVAGEWPEDTRSRVAEEGRRCRIGGTRSSMATGILTAGEVAERLMAALLKSAESKDFVGSNPTLSATRTARRPRGAS
jgi:hypothetical protein